MRGMDTWENDGGGIKFFASREAWQRHLARTFPTAHVTRERCGRRSIYRAYLRRHKLGVFGQLRGYGYLSGPTCADMLHGHAAR